MYFINESNKPADPKRKALSTNITLGPEVDTTPQQQAT